MEFASLDGKETDVSIRKPERQKDSTVIGQTVGTYPILEKLGLDGMGEVYQASDAKLNRQVAFNVLLWGLRGRS